MSEHRFDDQNRELETYVRDTAKHLAYPPTPDLKTTVAVEPLRRPRTALRLRWVQVMVAVLLLFGTLLAVPEIRAGVLEILRIGVIRIFIGEPTPTLTPAPTATGTRQPRPTFTPFPTPLQSVLDLPGETTLETARKEAGFSIPLPIYPPDLGEPDRVFLQNLGGTIVTLVWLEPGRSSDVRLSIQLLDEKVVASKYHWEGQRETVIVNDSLAEWLTDVHELAYFYDRDGGFARVVSSGAVLIWEDGAITYRMETDLSLDEAVKIAESMQE
jgi:hypothetical protein